MNNLRDRRAIILARHNSDRPDECLYAQVEVLRAYAQRHGIVVVDECRLENCFANGFKTRAVIQSLVDRARERDDYDVLLVTTLDRLSRGGSVALRGILGRFEAVGVTVVSADSSTAL